MASKKGKSQAPAPSPIEQKLVELRDCTHPNFHSKVQVYRLQKKTEATPHAFVAEVAVFCTSCGVPFQFLGMPCGNSVTHPMRAPDATTCRLPIAPPEFE